MSNVWSTNIATSRNPNLARTRGQDFFAARWPNGKSVIVLTAPPMRWAMMVTMQEAAAIANIGEIAEVPGIDVINIGTNDVAHAAGHPGEPEHPKVVALVDDAITVTPGDSAMRAANGSRLSAVRDHTRTSVVPVAATMPAPWPPITSVSA